MKFSIILPTYNRASFLPKTIESVLYQIYTDWELIIVDDGSTDNTKEVVQKYVLQESRIKYIYQENAERSAARNNGIKNAQGDYICFLDSDDLYMKNHLAAFQKLILESNNKIGLYFSGIMLGEKDINPQNYIVRKNPIDFVLENVLATPRACISKDINTFFNPNISIGEDTELWVRIAVDYPVFYHEKKTIIQTQHEDRSVLGKACYDSLNTLNHILGLKKLSNKISLSTKKTKLSKAYFNIAKYELTEGNKGQSVCFLIKSIWADVKNKQTRLKLNALIRIISFQKSTSISQIIN